MGQRGVLFALAESEVVQLKEIPNDQERLEWFAEHIEETFFQNRPDDVYELDKTWDGIHRILTDGTLSAHDNTDPLNLVILGGEALYSKENAYIMSLKTPSQIHEAALVLQDMTCEDFLSRHKQHTKSFWFRLFHDSGLQHMDQEYIDACWAYLEGMVSFLKRAADSGKYVLFTVDQ